MRFKDELQKQIYYKSQIDFLYYLLGEMAKRKSKPKTPIEFMVDQATGFSDSILEDEIKEAKDILKSIIKLKQKIGLDISGTAKTLSQINSKFKSI